MFSESASYKAPLLYDEDPSETDFSVILERFHISAEKWDYLGFRIGTDKQKELEKLLSDIYWMAESVAQKKGESLSSYALINWAEVLMSSKTDLASVVMPYLNKSAKRLDYSMTWIYLGLNFVDLILALATNVDLGAANLFKDEVSPQGSFWNLWDGLGSIGLGIRQIKQGEIKMGVANFISAGQVIGCTVTANVATYSSASASLGLTASSISALMGFSFAACMLISWGIEVYEIDQCDERIAVLNEELETEEDEIIRLQDRLAKEETQISPQSPDSTESKNSVNPNIAIFTNTIQEKLHKCELLKQTILLEEAKRADHVRNRDSWLACTFAMTGVALGAYFGLSVVTLGGLPIATAVIGLIALVTGIVRKWCVSNVNHTENLKKSLRPGQGKKSLYERVHDVIEKKKLGLDYNKKIHLGLSQPLSLKMYLTELLHKDPKKLEKLVTALENDNRDDFENEIKKHRNLGGSVGGYTTGFRMYRRLAPTINKNESRLQQSSVKKALK